MAGLTYTHCITFSVRERYWCDYVVKKNTFEITCRTASAILSALHSKHFQKDASQNLKKVYIF